MSAAVQPDQLLDLARAWGEVLREMRTTAGLTQSDAARQVGIARPNYSRSEHGLHTPRLEMVVRAAAVFGIDPTTLFGRIVERARQHAAGSACR